ncbi:MAG: CvpA family protein [Clostridia bacterium]|nr:CvpA family protein [Clostridia bacterium]
MSNFIRKFIYLIITSIVGLVSFYISLPAINFHSKEFYSYAIFLCTVYIVLTLIGKFFKNKVEVKQTLRENIKQLWNSCRIPTLLIAVLLAVSFLGGISSAEFLRAKSYSKLITVTTGDFSTDVKEISFDKIPYLDKDSAERLGDRKIGELADMVSQFEVSDDYAQINYKDKPVRVTPLEYGDIIKWFNNRKNGIPAYIVIDMATQAVDFVRLNEPIKYSESELFGRNIYRHIRFNYPTFMFAEPVFELDEDGVPYWVCPKIEMKIGLFGGADINGAVLVNAVTGESTYEKEVPTWVDRVYSADLIISQYDYYGTYKNGFLNSIFGQKDVTVTTDGYNYIALNDDVYMYTGITSVGGDQSNIGFILSNQRTKETKFYPCAGAAERSAQSSAQGVVQHLGYNATFPLLLNISDQPTYFMALKDKAELVKMYALVNVEQYQIVATGTTVAACEKEYIRLMSENNITTPQKPIETNLKGTITDIRTAVIDGNSTYYIKLDNSEKYYYITASQDIDVVTLNVGDFVSVDYDETSNEKIIKAYNITK